MPSSCEITFENPNRVFCAGQLLRGSVRLTLTGEEKVRGVYIHIHGGAYARWQDTCYIDHNYYGHHRNRSRENSSNTTIHSVTYEGSEVYLDEKTYFVGGPDYSNVRLPAGTKNYTFQCMLPPGLPSSIEDKVGHIRYGASLIIHNQYLANTKFNKELFTVIKFVNLNMDPFSRNPATGKMEKVFYPLGCLFLCPSGPLTVTASTPICGYTPGQTIEVNVNVTNRSNKSVSRYVVKLVQELTFRGRGAHYANRGTWNELIYDTRSKGVSYNIASKEVVGFSFGRRNSFLATLKVPSCQPTDNFSSNVVRVTYVVCVIGSVNGCCHKDVVVSLPITIGTAMAITN